MRLERIRAMKDKMKNTNEEEGKRGEGDENSRLNKGTLRRSRGNQRQEEEEESEYGLTEK